MGSCDQWEFLLFSKATDSRLHSPSGRWIACYLWLCKETERYLDVTLDSSAMGVPVAGDTWMAKLWMGPDGCRMEHQMVRRGSGNTGIIYVDVQ